MMIVCMRLCWYMTNNFTDQICMMTVIYSIMIYDMATVLFNCMNVSKPVFALIARNNSILGKCPNG